MDLLYECELRPPPRGAARGVPPPPAPLRVNPAISCLYD
nr:MAG TPA: hypothetical protein [Caudoviricetes sp.]